MIEQGFLKKHIVGRDGFIWWIGQIASEDSWKGNVSEGFGDRYRVRIMGHHTSSKNDVDDNELPFAYVMYPVTSGSGGKGVGQPALLQQGNFVFGFFIDGEDAQLPIIMGCLAFNQYQEILRSPDAETAFKAFEGYNFRDKVSVLDIKTKKEAKETDLSGMSNNGSSNNSTNSTNSIIQTSPKPNSSTKGNLEKKKEGQKKSSISKSVDCTSIPTVGIMVDLRNLMNEIEELRKSVNDIRTNITGGIDDIETEIQRKIDKATGWIASGIKNIIINIQKFALNQYNKSIKLIMGITPMNLMDKIKDITQIGNEKVSCIFKKIINSLLGMVGDFLSDIMKGATGVTQKFINFPSCLVDSFFGNILGSVIGQANNVINEAFNSIDSLLEIGEGIVNKGMEVVNSILNFLSCDERPSCDGVEEWSIWNGTSLEYSTSDIKGILNQAKGIATDIMQTGDDIERLSGNFTNAFGFENLNIDNIMKSAGNKCLDLSGPRTCGPPTTKFVGGIGGASNLIISSQGQVLGADMVNYGVNYIKNKVRGVVNDDCGHGSGANITPRLGDIQVNTGSDSTIILTPINGGVSQEVAGGILSNGNLGYGDNRTPIIDENGNPVKPGGTTKGIVDIVIDSPGNNYLSGPNGSLGGDGRVWSNPEDTIIQEKDGSYRIPFTPGIKVCVSIGDRIKLPLGTITEIEPSDGTLKTQSIFGGDYVTVTVSGCFTTPFPPDLIRDLQYPSSDNSYPVILYLCDIIIDDSGFGYMEGDEVVIEPSNGSSAIAKFNDAGHLRSIKVTNGGEGFKETPEIYIKSKTGYNASLRPKLCVDRISKDQIKEPGLQDRLVSVIDCVGKV